MRSLVNTDHCAETFSVIYCDKALSLFDPSNFLLSNFLTLTPYRRLAPESFIEVYWYAKDRESLSFRVYATYLRPDGGRDTYYYVHSGNGMVQHGDAINREFISFSTVAEMIKSAKKLDAVTLVSVTLRCGERSTTIFVDPTLSGIPAFFYVNCFNIVEQFPLPRITTDKLKVDRSIANLGRTSQFYDVSTTKEYEVQTAPLTSDECRQLEQLLSSPDVRLPVGTDQTWLESDFYAMHPILITDFTSELSDSDEKPNTAKFTWRFQENRPRFALKPDLEIFDNHFNPIFQ